MISTFFHEKLLPYLGPELRPHFILSKFKIEGNALLAFRGPCDVKTDHLVDWEDRLANDSIRAEEMLHFLGEFFGITLREGVWIQRLLVSEIQSVLLKKNLKVEREGDDLFIDGGKLSVSIVTASPVSVLLHLGLNINAKGAPVKTSQLKDHFTDEEVNQFASGILERFQNEFKSVERATVKVRPVI